MNWRENLQAVSHDNFLNLQVKGMLGYRVKNNNASNDKNMVKSYDNILKNVITHLE